MSLIDNLLLSISADATIRLWTPFGVDELNESIESKSCLNQDMANGVPTSIDFMNGEKNKFIASFTSSYHKLYDTETSQVICKLDFAGEDDNQSTHCYKVLSYPTSSNLNSSSSLVISAHEDRKIRFFDLNSGKLVNDMTAHQDAVTSLAIDPSCTYLLSSSHDCSLRLWNLENRNCIQDITAHRKKFDEAIHCVAFHPTKPFIASCGADAIVKIYV